MPRFWNVPRSFPSSCGIHTPAITISASWRRKNRRSGTPSSRTVWDTAITVSHGHKQRQSKAFVLFLDWCHVCFSLSVSALLNLKGPVLSTSSISQLRETVVHMLKFICWFVCTKNPHCHEKFVVWSKCQLLSKITLKWISIPEHLLHNRFFLTCVTVRDE